MEGCVPRQQPRSLSSPRKRTWSWNSCSSRSVFAHTSAYIRPHCWPSDSLLCRSFVVAGVFLWPRNNVRIPNPSIRHHSVLLLKMRAPPGCFLKYQRRVSFLKPGPNTRGVSVSYTRCCLFLAVGVCGGVWRLGNRCCELMLWWWRRSGPMCWCYLPFYYFRSLTDVRCGWISVTSVKVWYRCTYSCITTVN